MLAAVELGEVDETSETDGGSRLTLYRDNLERPLLEATTAFYSSESDRLFGEGSFFEYANYVSDLHIQLKSTTIIIIV